MKKIFIFCLNFGLANIMAIDNAEIKNMAKKYVVIKQLKQNALDTMLITAARMRKESSFFVDLIVKQKANINAIDLQGKTALMHAIINNDYETTRILLHLGASLSRKDSFNKDALSYAYEINNEAIIKLLKSVTQ